MIPPRTLNREQLWKLTAYLEKMEEQPCRNVQHVRNKLMIELMLYAGLRVGEMVRLLKTDLAYNGEPVLNLVVRREITKGHTERSVPLVPVVKNTIENCIRSLWTCDVNPRTEYAFESQKHRGHISTRQVERILEHASLEALGIRIHPHRLRHTFATRLMQKTNMRVVQQLLGHKHLSSTQIYTHPTAEDLRKAVEEAGIDTAEELKAYRAGRLTDS